ncbi:MAG TPA: RAMP superfamily CRISPR-associated protein [Thermoanaerobaculia bacterium]|nr:RAMP superfamily CRISPR-associated protein [Thermoanaerobaculia bacterium]
MRLRIRFDSDWRVGSGAGLPGSLDDLVQREEDGLPVLPAKTVKGMLRDGCELVAATLGGEWPQVVEALLGTDTHTKEDDTTPNLPARLGVRRGALPDEVRRALLGSHQAPLRDALTFAMPHVKIDPRTGAAEKDFLFHLEVARAGAELVAELDPREPLTEAQQALLHAGAAAVRRMGGKRRRGLGRCTVSVEDGEAPPSGAPSWLAWLELHHASLDLTDSIQPLRTATSPGEPAWGGRPGGGAAAPATDGPSIAPRPAGEWWSVPLSLEAKTPLCLPRRTVGNLVEGLDHVPGTLLLPLLHAALAAGGADAAELIRAGRALVTHAYPVQTDGSPSWPAPHALSAEKGSRGLETPDAPVVNELLPGETATEPTQRKALRQGYVTASTGPGERPRYLHPSLEASMHNTVEDRRQRPTEDVGGVFTFQVIPTGTRLAAEVRLDAGGLPPALTSQELQDLLAQAARGYAVGRAKADEYGQVEITPGAVRHLHAEADEPETELRPGNTLTVWLLSDTLLRDPFLGWSARPEDLQAALEEALEARLSMTPEGPVFARGRRTEGWVRSWELPRPSLTALAAGSCFRFHIERAPADLAIRLRRLHLTGLGERRAEGYGQVRFEPPLLASGEVPRGDKQEGLREPDTGGSEESADATSHDSPFLRTVEEEAWKEAIRRRAFEIGGGPEPLGMDPSPAGIPPNSQLGALRAAVLALRDLRGESRIAVLAWLVHLLTTTKRFDKWPAAALETLRQLLEGGSGPRSAGEWTELDERLRHEDRQKREAARAELRLPASFSPSQARVWSELFAEDDGDPAWPPTATPGGRERLAEELWPFAVTTLVQSVCASVLDHREAERTRGARAAATEEEPHGAAAR